MRCATETHLRIHCILTTVALIWPAASFPQTPASGAYPNKPVRYVVTFAAGAAPDTVARLLAERLTRLWGQQVIVDNRVGVAGLLGAAFVAKSPPDGYTLVQCNIGTNTIAVSLYAKVPFDQNRDFAPVTRIGTTPNVIVVHPSVPFRTIKQMVAYARGNPGKLSFAAGLAGTSQPLMMELLKLIEKNRHRAYPVQGWSAGRYRQLRRAGADSRLPSPFGGGAHSGRALAGTYG